MPRQIGTKMNDEYKKTLAMVKKHLGEMTPNWIVEKVVSIINEFYRDKNLEIEQLKSNVEHWKEMVEDPYPKKMMVKMPNWDEWQERTVFCKMHDEIMGDTFLYQNLQMGIPAVTFSKAYGGQVKSIT